MSLKRLAESRERSKVKDVDPEDDFIREEGDILGKKPSKDDRRSSKKGKEAAPRSKLRANAAMADIESDAKYQGKVVPVKRSRSKAGYFDDEDEEDEEEGSEEEDEEAGSIDGHANGEAKESYVVDRSELLEKGQGGRKAISRTTEDPSAALFRPGTLIPHGKGGADLAEDLDAELAALEYEDAAAMTATLRRSDEEREKGIAVQQQIALNEFFLETRIRLQKPLVSAVSLPSSDVLSAVAAQQPALQKKLNELRSELKGLMADLLQLRFALVDSNPDVSTRVSGAKRGRANAGADFLPEGVAPKAKRQRHDENAEEDSYSHISAEEFWRAAHSGWIATEHYRDDTVNTWGRKLAYASGLTAKQALKLKVVVADVTQQVNEILRDKERIIARSRPRQEGVRVLCQARQQTLDDYFMEGYDDQDFYQQLLREFVASSSASHGGDTGASEKLIGMPLKHSSKKRSDVDRRATKGRRIKYVVHPKLVNFVAPAPYVVPPDLSIDLDTVVASLFKSA